MLQVRRLEKTIDNRTALSIEELDIHAGDIVTLVGQISSGKTLLMRLLCGMLVPSGGKVLLDGKDVHSSPEARSRIGVMFEEDLLYDRMSAQGNLELYCRLHNMPTSRAGEVLAQLGMSDQASRQVSKLSPVAQRRLAFARALIGRPSLLLLDQPELRIDLDTQSLFLRLIKEVADAGTTVLITAEDLAWSGHCSAQIVELADGRIVSKRVRESSQAEPAAPERLMPFKIPARKEDRIMLFDPGEVLYATSREGKTYLRTTNEEATTNLTLQELETRLAGRGFFKAHRAYLVNLQHIKG
jgi:ABC-2 type transport system ATP-binding protein